MERPSAGEWKKAPPKSLRLRWCELWSNEGPLWDRVIGRRLAGAPRLVEGRGQLLVFSEVLLLRVYGADESRIVGRNSAGLARSANRLTGRGRGLMMIYLGRTEG